MECLDGASDERPVTAGSTPVLSLAQAPYPQRFKSAQHPIGRLHQA